jgi:uncharacterized membrane protein YoaK (UPF0700 family)
VFKGLLLLLGFAVGVAAVVWLPWQFAAIAVCILFVFALVTYLTAQAKLPPERSRAKAEEKKGDGAN